MNGDKFPPHPLVADPAYARLKEYLIASTGLAYYAEKDRDLAERVAQRLGRVGLRDCASYLAFLSNGETSGQEELDALIVDLTIGETFFFRHRELFDALRTTVLPALIARNQHSRKLRIWSAGCATGPEAYSVAILLKRDLAPLLAGWEVTIVGTDINRAFLAQAREGVFEEWAFRTTPEEVKRSCFTRAGKSWRINPEYKDCVSFQYHNLVAHPFPSLLNNLFAFDVILCRNVTIYFSLDIVRGIIERFHQSLAEEGWLLVGHAEPNMELFRSFRVVNALGAVLYQKSREPMVPPVWFAPLLPSPEARSQESGVKSQGSGETPASLVPLLVGPATISEATGPLPAPLQPPAPAQLPLPVPPEPAGLDLIRTLADRGDWNQAAACCQEMLARDKLNPAVYFYQALILEQMGLHAEAEDALRRVIYLGRQFVLGHYYLGLLLQKKGQLPQAARSFRNVLQLLERTAPDHVFANGDGITAGELRKLTQMHLKVLEGA